jgi:serine/threonine protein kinase
LDKTRFKPNEVKTIGTEILIGLQELHQSKMFFRELAPDRVYLSDDFRKCTLTDFELAKVLQKVPTVSGPWRTSNPYRAPENVESRTIAPTNYARTDIYSWAAIVIELFTGDPNAESEALAKKLHDPQLVTYLMACRSPIFSERPKSVVDVLDVWNKWMTK